MHDLYEDLHELCEVIEKDIAKTNEKLRMSGGEMSGSDLEYVDKLTHAMKSIKTTMAMMDAEEDGYSREGSGRNNSNGSYSGNYGMNSGRYYPGYSYAGRGRGSNAKRDSMGRYSRGYSRGDEEMVEEVRELMEKAPDEQTRRDFQKILDRMEK